MDSPAMNEPKRPRGRPALGRARIVEAALGVIDEGGADALTFRAVAKRLSSSTATLYRHVESRSELLGLVMDHLLGLADQQIRAHLDTNANWDEVCRASARISYRVLSSHNASAHLFTNRFPLGPNGMTIRERMLAALIKAGFTPMMAVNTVATISHYVVGFAMQNDATVSRSTLDNTFGGAGGDRYPATASVVHLLPRPLDEEFEFGLGLIFDALTTGLLRSAPPAEDTSAPA
jgi:TetR/AcrR family tetracycline transcriptional repressor